MSDVNGDNVGGDNGVSVVNVAGWDTLHTFYGNVQDVIRWQDSLLIAGGYWYINSDPIRYLACYDSTSYHPYGEFDEKLRALRIVGNELYALGYFVLADGDTCNGLARRVGGHWESVGFPNSAGHKFDLIEYQGELILGGLFDLDGQSGYDIARYDGNEWHILGPGLLGNGNVFDMQVYQGDLYVAGGMLSYEGNAATGIMRWDGTQFHQLGGGIQGLCGTANCPAGVLDMVVHNDLLYMVGSFSFVDGMPTPGVAVWDGTYWCAIPGDLNPLVNNIEWYNDTLYVTPNVFAEGVDVNSAAKFVGAALYDGCTGPLSVTGENSNPERLLFTPNPAGDHCMVRSEQAVDRITIMDMQGTLLMEHRIDRDTTVDVSRFAPGTYLARGLAVDGHTIAWGRIVKR